MDHTDNKKSEETEVTFDSQVISLRSSLGEVLESTFYGAVYGIRSDAAHLDEVEASGGARWIVRVWENCPEYAGGACDGKRISGGFKLDVGKLLLSFKSVSSVFLNHDVLGTEGISTSPYLSVTGVFAGLPVEMAICTSPPPESRSDHSVNSLTGAVTIKSPLN